MAMGENRRTLLYDANGNPLVRGQQTMANSLGVTIASDQSAVKVDGSAVTQPISGAITSSSQALGANHHASSTIIIATGTGSLAARATRTGGFLRARITNAAAIVLSSGLSLFAGDQMSMTAIDSFAFTGTNGDILDVYEEYN